MTKQKATQATTERRRRFNAVHRKGMDALKRGDYKGTAQAIEDEHAIIEEQRVAMEKMKPKTRR